MECPILDDIGSRQNPRWRRDRKCMGGISGTSGHHINGKAEEEGFHNILLLLQITQFIL